MTPTYDMSSPADVARFLLSLSTTGKEKGDSPRSKWAEHLKNERGDEFMNEVKKHMERELGRHE